MDILPPAGSLWIFMVLIDICPDAQDTFEVQKLMNTRFVGHPFSFNELLDQIGYIDLSKAQVRAVILILVLDYNCNTKVIPVKFKNQEYQQSISSTLLQNLEIV